ncbi:BatD family protein [Haliangium ochraceum]|uniref:Tetratricopeptide TPR_2 repeat protein n=1 Tax=Haliangium ochraceum (strain DSM 14365 / JCM 11303 / SMP-2) TaxID=502025 RepID=D0LKD0_HALO1|nr:BatD family protein [Haliangium ochraceum]ACY13164.1 Tetratricopeptide TPR_2 repeat protein [Haliangium ochraceum DSM 14365]
MSKRFVAALSMSIFALVLLAAGAAHAQRATLHLQSGDAHEGLPFIVAVSAEGFAPEPQPEIEEFAIAGAELSFLGVTPNVSSSVMIRNGRRSETRRVEFVYRYRIVAPKAGLYRVPAIRVSQGSVQASTRPSSIRVTAVPSSEDMAFRLDLPERAVSVGETFDLGIEWLLRRDPSEHSFSVPLLDDGEWFDVHVPPPVSGRRQTLSVPAGDRQLELPFTQDRVTVSGREYTRVRMAVSVTPVQAGTYEVAPAQAVAELEVGTGRDRFGFPVARTQLFRARDTARTLEIRPLPLANRPPSFAGAVGTSFSIKVQASRSVVSVGEPIDLDILVRGDGRMEGLSLGPLIASDRLSEDEFSVVDGALTGTLSEDDNGKRFHVTVRLKSPDVREIPPLAFSYFDPARNAYETVRSEPIALQVAGSAVVGAADVVSAAAAKREGEGGDAAAEGAAQDAAGGARSGTFAGAEFALSAADETLDEAATTAGLLPLILAIYGLALLVAAGRTWQVRTRAARGQSSELRQAKKRVDEAVRRAESQPAREAAPEVLAALRHLARLTEQRASGEVIARLETEAYAPAAAEQPLAADLRDDIGALASSWMRAQRESDGAATGRRAGAAALLLLVGAALSAAPARAQQGAQPGAQQGDGQAPAAADAAPAASAATGAASLEAARALYAEALGESSREARARGFAQAERLFGALVEQYPDRPELLADWGNAALGAQDLGRAALAYRRALAHDPGNQRAARNLDWVRARVAVGSAAADASSDVIFWRYLLSPAERHVLGALAFALGLLLLAPWAGWRLRWRALLAALPLLLWLAMLLSLATDPDPADDAVVLGDGVTLRTADSAGAPQALASTLPAGAEVRVDEIRGEWTRVVLGDDLAGWLPSSALAPVMAR